ncbi:hypothetical protein AOL_s00076g496 [Orbilia oligospora ATCC 24927]|uniref:Uncharacterized protein n=1 Tax=Arthrobotrys oligospora (strain ATCC 24927 / CBS 115.81 / DSM 1491) TaxID=756982 RepID=G1XA38_ARTOA|nr:hypothetical protein AOL_s00076g496 [Orbilia oligospora ATCC 24927]EGX50010.1 hypothetical protein AOL_s00076g496 [Orbilia oligospora ATCC 24927]
MFTKSVSVLFFSLLALVSIATAIPFNPRFENDNALELNRRGTCNADNLLRYLRAHGLLGQASCRTWLNEGSTTTKPSTGGTKTVTVATESPTITLTKSIVSTKTVYTTIVLATTTNTRSFTVTSTTTVTATQTVVQLKAVRAKVRKDKIVKKAAARYNILEPFTSDPARLSSACSCVLPTVTPKPADTPTATVSVTATSPVNVDTTVFVVSTVTSTITQSAAVAEVSVTETVVRTETTRLYTRVWIQ